MATLSWNEIRARATTFANEWKSESSEHAEAKTFWDQFFEVFGVSRRRVATFEERVKKVEGKGYIDLLWKNVLLVEHKSKGQNLDHAYQQAKDYFPGIRDSDLPQYILVSDFENFRLYDLENGGERNFKLENLPKNIELFSFIAGYKKQNDIKEQDPVNIQAAEKMGKLHDKLSDIGYRDKDLEVYLVRLLFCLFADDTGIFDKNYFRDYIQQETYEDGKDLGTQISQIFQVLNTPVNERYTNMSELLNGFPYVNGKLFEEQLRIASFDREMRDMLLECTILDWGKISPAVFGSLFQSVMNKEERRILGAHYTSEENIMKVIKPLFLDDLWKEFNLIKQSEKQLEAFHNRLSELRFLDPACGCGNFLIITYRELRILEMEVLRELLKEKTLLDIGLILKIDVDQFYGIEIGEFSSQIAQVALWLIDHQMNMIISQEFGQYYVRLPLSKKPNIVHGNALKIDWTTDVMKNKKLHYLFGNPPFAGSWNMSKEQKEDMRPILKDIENAGQLDFVCAWFIKASHVIQGTSIRVAFVSTNSIVQGEQAIALWKYLLNRQGVSIEYAHQTFQWKSEAKGKAAVFCIIVGFSKDRHREKKLYLYPNIKGEPTLIKAKKINQYLLDAPTIFIEKRRTPISDVPPMIKGSQATDGGQYLFTESEKKAFIEAEPGSEAYFRLWIGAKELLTNSTRYTLYLRYCPPNELRKMKLVLKRVEAVRIKRLESRKLATKKWAENPTMYTEDRVQDEDILIIPCVSSQNRKYIPIGYYSKGTIGSNKVFQIPNANLYIFGLLNSTMHMAWMRTVGGRLKGDYNYANTLVYNTFPFPEPTNKQIINIEKASKQILEARKPFLKNNHTLADLYDDLAMPYELRTAHNKLDTIIDNVFGYRKMKTDQARVEFLFGKYTEKQKNFNIE